VGVILVLTGLTRRLRRDLLLRQITGLRAVLLAAAALTAVLHQPAGAVIALGAASSSLSWTYRPLQAASLPWLVRTPAELTASNAVAAVMENSGATAGPLVAGGLLAIASPVAAMALAAATLGAAAASLHGLAVPDPPEAGGRSVAQAIRDVTSGIAGFVRVAPPAGVAVLIFAQTFVRGALVVLIAVLAVHYLALGGSAVGWLNAAFGAGGLLGGALAAAAVRVTRLGRSFIIGLLLWDCLLWLSRSSRPRPSPIWLCSSPGSAMRSRTPAATSRYFANRDHHGRATAAHTHPRQAGVPDGHHRQQHQQGGSRHARDTAADRRPARGYRPDGALMIPGRNTPIFCPAPQRSPPRDPAVDDHRLRARLPQPRDLVRRPRDAGDLVTGYHRPRNKMPPQCPGHSRDEDSHDLLRVASSLHDEAPPNKAPPQADILRLCLPNGAGSPPRPQISRGRAERMICMPCDLRLYVEMRSSACSRRPRNETRTP
jgi:hypothetical protein